MSTAPSPSPYAWRTEFEHASVSASLRSASVSSLSGRSRESPVSANRPSVMYSALAGIVSRMARVAASTSQGATAVCTVPVSTGFAQEILRQTSIPALEVPSGEPYCPARDSPNSGARVRRPPGEHDRHPAPLRTARDRERRALAGGQPLRDDAEHVVRAPHGLAGDGDDDVAVDRDGVAVEEPTFRRRAQTGAAGGAA